METTVNIGLNVNGVEALTTLDVLNALRSVGVETRRFGVRHSNTEATVVAETSRPLTPEEGLQVARLLRQEAIAQQDKNGNGELFGPNKEVWEPFNPAYFLRLP